MNHLSMCVAVGFVVCSGASAGSRGTLNGRIVFTATDAPFADDVMLVRANGDLIDLSKSPALDTAPLLAPDGRVVAFFSNRDGYNAEYVVSIDGSGLRRVTPALPSPPSIAWSPSSTRLAVLTETASGQGSLHLASRTGGYWKLVTRGDQPSLLVGWSPNGERIAYTTQLGTVKIVSAEGRVLLNLSGQSASWSPSGRLAVARDSTTEVVYDTSGKLVAKMRNSSSAAWSPTDLLATMGSDDVLQVRDHGSGQPIVSARFPQSGFSQWVSPTVVQLQGPNGVFGYDVRRHQMVELPAAYAPLSSALPKRGVAWGEAPFGTLALSHLGGATQTVTTVPYCQGKDSDAFQYLQALPNGSGAVFAGDCAQPNDIFAIRPDGSELTRLTNTPEDEQYVSVSPDGSRLGFTRAPGARCVGCDEQIWTENVDGSDPVEISLPASTAFIRQDQDPSFSPDGSSLVFSRWISSLGDQGRLYRVAVSGGAATGLGIAGGDPVWGPSRIAFLGSGGVETVAADGSHVSIVKGLATADEGPLAWSNSGQLAVLRSTPPLAIVFPSSGRRIALPGLRFSIADTGGGLAWSPDGSKMAFVAADANGVGDIWVINADGSGLTRLTHNLDVAGTLSWR